jgi:RNA polymerase sigma-70 factor (ECF subfamily)
MYELELNIIKKIKDGDINAFEQIVDKYKNKALTLSMSILKNREEAEDSLQEAFVKAFRAIVDRKFEGRSKFSTYFYSIVYNTALDSYRKLKTRTYNLINIEDTSSRYGTEEGTTDISAFEMKLDKSKVGQHGHYPAEKELLDNELQELVNEFMVQIPEKYSLVLTMFYINDLSLNEISEILHMPLGTVKNRIFRAKEKLKDILLNRYSYESILEFI